MDSIRIGASLPQPVESETAGPVATKPDASVASGPKSTSTGNEGQVFQPSAGDEVLVSFEHGDPRAPYVTGGSWNGDTPPPDAASATGSEDKRLSDEREQILNHQLKNLK